MTVYMAVLPAVGAVYIALSSIEGMLWCLQEVDATYQSISNTRETACGVREGVICTQHREKWSLKAKIM